MKLLLRIAIVYVANLIALVTAGMFVPGVTVDLIPEHILITTGTLTLLTLLFLPLLSFITKPLIMLTLGLLIFGLNALLLVILDSTSTWVTIEGLQSLTYAAIITTGAHALARLLSPR